VIGNIFDEETRIIMEHSTIYAGIQQYKETCKRH